MMFLLGLSTNDNICYRKKILFINKLIYNQTQEHFTQVSPKKKKSIE